MKSVPFAPYEQQGDIALSMRVNDLLWTAFIGTTLGNDIPYVRGGSTGLPGNFVHTPGQFAGSATVTTTGNFDMIYGTPLHIEVRLCTGILPCCFGASVTENFYHSAYPTGVDAYANGSLVTDWEATTSSGLRLNSQGVSAAEPPATAVPGPGGYAMMLIGLSGISALMRRRAARQ